MATHRIALIPGDGIGNEVTAQAVKALDAAAGVHGFSFETESYDLGGERFLATGEVLSDATLEELRGFDGILLGAVGLPEVPPGVLERGLLLRLRFAFDQYVNLRPVRLYPGVPSPIAGLTPEDCDFVVVRENTEGPYAGHGGNSRTGTPHEVATQNSINTRMGVERVMVDAFERAMKRGKRVTVAHKTNVLINAGDLWMRTAGSVAERFPEVEWDYVHVDAACLYMVGDPGRFDVMVTDNLFGDIITDLGAAIQGGIGLAASGNIAPTRTAPSMFEPVHGSAPDIAGQGLANPVAAVVSASMLLDHLGEEDAAVAVHDAAVAELAGLPAMAGPGMGSSTDEIGDRIAGRIAR